MFRMYNDSISGIRAVAVGTYEEGVLTIAVSRCSRNDNFSKVKGLKLAERRLKYGRYFEKINLKECTNESFCRIAKPLLRIVEVHPRVYHLDIITRKEEVRKKFRVLKYKDAIKSLENKIQKLEGTARIISISDNRPLADPEE